MTSDASDASRRRRANVGVHRKKRRGRSWLTRAVAAGGAAVCVGAAHDLTTPTADALSILLPGPTVNGVGSATRINIFEGNIFNPQLGISGGSTSTNSTSGNVAVGQGNNIINQLLSAQINLAGPVGNGNLTQINILSYNIFNPQFSLVGPNISNNTSVNNVAMNNGNNSTTEVSPGGGTPPWLGSAAGNGNTTQFSFFSGNIFNPQWSLIGGGNLSNNTTLTNVAIGNGNFSQATLSLGGWFGTFLFGGGNGNTTQFAFFVSNIYNPQFAFGGGNISNNTAATNTAEGNGNNSSTEVTGGTVVGGTVGNGNTNQAGYGSGNISNNQVNIGQGSTSTATTTVGADDTEPVNQLLSTQATANDSTDSRSDEPANRRVSDADAENDSSTETFGDRRGGTTGDPGGAATAAVGAGDNAAQAGPRAGTGTGGESGGGDDGSGSDD